MIVAGVDDAGRGSVLGPLVIAGVSIDESKVPKLVELGVKDSKLLTAARRRKLFKDIKAISDQVTWTRIKPDDIDSYVLNGVRLFRLNYLEAKHMALVLGRLKYDLAYVDCCDTDQKRFGKLIESLMQEQDGKCGAAFGSSQEPDSCKIRSEHHADRNYPVVSAASIIAKVTRDTYISRLQREHGLFGSGYPSDPDTVEFLRGFISKSQKLPDFTRTSWKTIDRLNQEFEMRVRIDDYLNG
ncbi:MAG: ribonuclease HII [Nitrososphaerales archaeon]